MRIFPLMCLIFFISCNFKRPSIQHQGTDKIKPFEINKFDEGLHQITCWGIGNIELEDDLTLIEEKVGKNNVSQDSFFLEGMFKRSITVVYKDTPNQIDIHWKEKTAPYKTIDYLEISNLAAPYQFNNGVKLGITLKELETLNAKSFKLYGFG